jgi:hypothetical protein
MNMKVVKFAHQFKANILNNNSLQFFLILIIYLQVIWRYIGCIVLLTIR